MTADVELLPLYAELQGHPKLEIIKHYARANVAHATAAKDAEIEALRAEVEALKHDVGAYMDSTLAENAAREQAEARAERLRSAAQFALDYLNGHECINNKEQREVLTAALAQQPGTEGRSDA